MNTSVQGLNIWGQKEKSNQILIHPTINRTHWADKKEGMKTDQTQQRTITLVITEKKTDKHVNKKNIHTGLTENIQAGLTMTGLTDHTQIKNQGLQRQYTGLTVTDSAAAYTGWQRKQHRG